MSLGRWTACRLTAAWIACCAQAAQAQAPAAPPPPLPADEARAVYQELLHTHDGEVYTLNIVGFPTEAAAIDAWAKMNQPPAIGQRLDKAFKGVTPRPRYLFSLEPALRERVVNLGYGGRTGPVKTWRGWAIAELVETRATAAPKFAEVEPSLAGLVASGTLPSAAQLRDDPVLRQRSALNAIQSIDDLRAAPAGLDLNGLRSSYFTPLLHALYLDRLDLVQALLDRGADPNRCAHANCPLRSAILIGSAAAVDVLLKAGANPDGVAPEIGVIATPLVAAAARGDLALARRLIAAGARIEGYGDHGEGQTPLMAAAARADRAMADLLLEKGADPMAVRTGIPPALRMQRSVVDNADASRNSEFAAWLRDMVRSRARASGTYAWAGWIEQDGVRQPIDGRPVTLRKAPFRMIFRMHPERELYVTASTGAEAYARFRKPAPGPAGFHSRGAISAEDDKNRMLVIHAPQPEPKPWGGSQVWWASGAETRFSASVDTPQGREYTREIGEFVLIDADDKIRELAIEAYPERSLHLIAGTRVRLGWLDDDVFEPRFVELRFR